jgi:hypothetical protein
VSVDRLFVVRATRFGEFTVKKQLLLSGLALAMSAGAFAQDRVNVSQKGSVLIYSNVEVKWNQQGTIVQDTFIELTNDNNAPVDVHLYFLNGDAASATEPGWNWSNNTIHLTADEPAYWAASTGQPKGVSPWSVLDPGNPPGRPDPDDANLRTLRGVIFAWAVNADDYQIRWNHLTGKAIIVNYASGAAAEYEPFAFQARNVNQGDVVGRPGLLAFDGINYDLGFDRLVLDFYASGTLALSGGSRVVGIDTDLTLHPISTDLRQDNRGPIKTKAKFDIWNQNEVRFSGTEKCITCWDQALLSGYAATNHFLLGNLQTDKGKARINGEASTVCDTPDFRSVNASLLGVSVRLLSFDAGQASAATATTLVGQGTEQAAIAYDPVSPPGELQGRMKAIGVPAMDAAEGL